MTDPTPRRRAPGLNPDQRRDMIVRTALPLLVEHGATVTTQQIAKAAGIGEATVFRAFTDKDELLQACLVAAIRNDHVLAELDEVPLDQPLPARLIEAAASLRAYLDRMGAVIAAVGSARGGPLTRRSPDEARSAADLGADRAEATDRTFQAVIRLLDPDRDTLRVPAEHAAGIFLALLFPRRGGPAAPPLDVLVDVLLHGVVT